MAYQQDFNDDEQNQTQTQTGNETVLTPASTSLSTSPSTSPAPTSSKPKGTGFTNLSQYVDANRPQSAEMAGQVTNKISENIASQNQAAQTAAQNTQKQAAANTVQDNGVSAQLNKDPTAFNQSQWQDYYKNATKAYAGPTSFENTADYQNLANQAAQNKQAVENLKTNEGRSQAVQDQYGADRNYSRGQNLLDSFLIGTGGGSEKLGEFQSKIAANDPNAQWQSLIDQTNAKIKSAQDTSAQTKQKVENLAQSKLGFAQNAINTAQSNLNAQNQTATKQLQTIQSQLNSPDVKARSEAFKSLGLDPAAGEWLISQGYNPNQLIQQSQLKGLGDVADAKDVANYQALSSLLGQQSQLDFTKTGGADNAYSVNKDATSAAKSAFDLNNLLGSRLTSEQQKRDKSFSDAQQAISSTTFAPRSPEEQVMAARALGLTPAEYSYAMDKGLFNNSQLTQGAKLNLGDVAKGNESAQLSSLMKSLGIAAPSLADTQNEGSAFSYNPASVKDAYAKYMADIQAAPTLPTSLIPAAVQKTATPAAPQVDFTGLISKLGGNKAEQTKDNDETNSQ